MTNETSFTVNLRVINALAKIAPKKDIRYYLQSVCVEAAPDAIYYVATNGHMLTVVREEYENGETGPDTATQYLIPREIAAKVKPGRNLAHGRLTIAAKTGESPAEFTIRNGETIGGTLVDGTFPDWRRVVPRELSGAVAQFNPDYHATIQDTFRAAVDSDKAVLEVRTNGEAVAALANGAYPDFLALLMPIRAGAEFAIPAWALENPATAKQQAA